jgi:RND superfamily putative drug exporter
MTQTVTPKTQPRPRALARLADLSYRRRGRVVLAWVAALFLVFGLSASLAGEYSADYSAHGSDSDQAQQLLNDRFPGQAGQTIDVVVRTDGRADAPAVRTEVERLLAAAGEVRHVVGTSSPYEAPGGISRDGKTALGGIQTDVPLSESMPVADTKRILRLAEDVNRPGLRVELGGQPVAEAEAGAIGSEAIGLIAAAIILLVTFGSVIAAGLPIFVAVLGLAIGTALIGLLAAVIETPDWALSLAAMMGIGVGIDYVLLMLTRFREFIGQGMAPRAATVATVETAGRAVLVAGSTVVISLLGLFATDLNYMQGAAVATIAVVLVIMIAAVTLLPALLGYLGTRVDRLRLPGTRHRPVGGSPMWARWSHLVQRRPWPALAIAVAILAVLAVPFFGVRYGFPDAGNEPSERSARQAYDLVSEGFGPGFNGPLLVVAEQPAGQSGAPVAALADRLRTTPGVASVAEPQRDRAGTTALLVVTPTTAPQDAATERLVRTIRDDLVPTVTGAEVHVGGATAQAIDTNEDIVSKLPLLIGGVVVLSFLLLLVVFHSIVVAVKAALLNVLSIAAAYGVVGYVLEGGWAGKLIGIDTPTPLPAFIPVLMFAILFGLSMDYEVFLISRIREYWLKTGDNSRAVADGVAATGRVITAAAAIMVSVFLAFAISPDVFLKVIGIGLATAIFVDATIVRMLLVPAIMQLMGRANWWLPGWLDRKLPELHVEGPAEPTDLSSLPAPRAGHEREQAPV